MMPAGGHCCATACPLPGPHGHDAHSRSLLCPGLSPQDPMGMRPAGGHCCVSAWFNFLHWSPVIWGFPGAAVIKNPLANAADIRDGVRSLGWEDPPEEEMAIHPSVPAWRIPRTEQPGGYSPWGGRELDTPGGPEQAPSSERATLPSPFPFLCHPRVSCNVREN